MNFGRGFIVQWLGRFILDAHGTQVFDAADGIVVLARRRLAARPVSVGLVPVLARDQGQIGVEGGYGFGHGACLDFRGSCLGRRRSGIRSWRSRSAACSGVVAGGRGSVSGWRLQEHPPISNAIATNTVPRIAIPRPGPMPASLYPGIAAFSLRGVMPPRTRGFAFHETHRADEGIQHARVVARAGDFAQVADTGCRDPCRPVARAGRCPGP